MGWVLRATTLPRFTPEEMTPGAHCIGWVGLRAGLDTGARGKILCLCRGSNPNRPVRSLTLYWLSYPSSFILLSGVGKWFSACGSRTACRSRDWMPQSHTTKVVETRRMRVIQLHTPAALSLRDNTIQVSNVTTTPTCSFRLNDPKCMRQTRFVTTVFWTTLMIFGADRKAVMLPNVGRRIS
jgi:hypothetical protein